MSVYRQIEQHGERLPAFGPLEIDWTHPYAWGLKSFIVLRGLEIRDLVLPQRTFDIVAGSISPGVTEYGLGSRLANSTRITMSPAITIPLRQAAVAQRNQAYTVLTALHPHDSAGVQFIYRAGAYSLRTDASDFNWDSHNVNPLTEAGDGFSLTLNEAQTLGLTLLDGTGGVGRATASHSGRTVKNLADANVFDSTFSTFSQDHLLSDNFNQSVRATVNLYAVWNRVFSEDEINDLTTRPFQVLKPARRLYSVATAAEGVALDIPIGTLAFVGNIASVSSGKSLAVDSASMSLSAQNPAASGGSSVLIPRGSLTLTALDAQLGDNATIDLEAAPLLLSVLAPSVFTGVANAVDAGTLSLNGLAPNLQLIMTVGLASLTLSELEPAVAIGSQVSVPLGGLNLAGLNVDLSLGAALDLDAKALTLAGLAITVNPDLSQRNAGVHPTRGVSRSSRGAVDYLTHIGDAGVADLGTDQS